MSIKFLLLKFSTDDKMPLGAHCIPSIQEPSTLNKYQNDTVTAKENRQ